MKTRMFDLVRQLGELGAWVRLHYMYPYPHIDAVLELMAEAVQDRPVHAAVTHGMTNSLLLYGRGLSPPSRQHGRE